MTLAAPFMGIGNALAKRALETPHQLLFKFRGGRNDEPASYTFGQLHARAAGVARALLARGEPGQRTFLLCPPGPSFVEAFFGSVYAGMTPVPMAPPEGGAQLRARERLLPTFHDASPQFVITKSAAARDLRTELTGTAGGDVYWLGLDQVDPDPTGQPMTVGLETPVFLQYTSGSTARPKGVCITHGNLAANLGMIAQAFRLSPSSRGVSWLPPFHDMGLVSAVLTPVYVGFPATLMSPSLFLRRPEEWLRAISEERATVSGGPNFAFDYCVDRYQEAQFGELNLSSWATAFVGAEPVRARTMRRFAEAFQRHNFRPSAWTPCYGLAEATLLVSCHELGTQVRTARPTRPIATANASPVELVSNGKPASGSRLLIRDPSTGAELPDGSVGEVLVAGPHVGQGYWSQDSSGGDVFHVRVADDGVDYLATGDLGFLDQGELFIAGRAKDLIIVRGRNHAPEDLEESLRSRMPSLVAVAAVGESSGATTERLVVLAEVAASRKSRSQSFLIDRIVEVLVNAHGVKPDVVVLLRRGALPRTTSGKIQRGRSLGLWQSRALAVLEARSAMTGGQLTLESAAVAQTEANDPVSAVRSIVASLIGKPLENVPADANFAALGFDSLDIARALAALENRFGKIPPAAQVVSMTVRELAAAFAAEDPADSGFDHPRGMPELSPFQEALWCAGTLERDHRTSMIWRALRLSRDTDLRWLEAACEEVVRQHSLLRLRIRDQDGAPQCEIAQPSGGVLETWVTDLPLKTALATLTQRPVDLGSDGPLRICLLQTQGAAPVLAIGVHHLAVDFASASSLLTELGASKGAHRATSLGAADTFWRYAGWRRAGIAASRRREATDYWLERMSGAPPFLDLPVDRQRVACDHHVIDKIDAALTPDETARLLAMCATHGVTPFQAAVTAIAVALGKLTGTNDLVIGAVFRDDPPSALRQAAGPMINLLPLRLHIDETATFATAARLTGVRAAEAAAQQGLAFAELVRLLRPPRKRGAHPIFQTLVSWYPTGAMGENATALALGSPGTVVSLSEGVEAEILEFAETRSPFELTFAGAVLGGRLQLALSYASDLFDRATAVWIADVVLTALRQVGTKPDSTLAKLFAGRSATAAAPEERAFRSLLARIEAHAKAQPSAPAVFCHGRVTSYESLLCDARAIAARLASAGAARGDRIVIDLPRSSGLVAAMLGVWMVGGAYVPVDRTHPPERIGAQIRACCARLAVCERAHPWGSLGVEAIAPANSTFAVMAPASAAICAEPDELAYEIFTSGSTGEPKGVAITHGNASAFIDWALTAFGTAARGKVLASTPATFDLSIFELFLPLCGGGTTVIVDNLFEWLTEPIAVDLVNTVPSLLSEFLRQPGRPPLPADVCVAGERLSLELAEAVLADGPNVKLWNLYAPAETTTYSTAAEVRRGVSRAPPIGRGVGADRVELLDARLQPVLPLVVGEVYIGGQGVARGYAERPALTAERFVPDPFGGAGGRLYRTGDLARRRLDGDLEYTGRADTQVKIHGMRVELGEVEAVIADHEGVAEARAVVMNGPRIGVAFTRNEKCTPSPSELEALSRARLPAAMRPAVFLNVAALPRNRHGKLDQSRLVQLLEAAQTAQPGRNLFAPPDGPTAVAIHDIWTELLDQSHISADACFFDVGGDSVLAMRLAAAVHLRFGVKIDLHHFHADSTIEGLAHLVDLLLWSLDRQTERPGPRVSGLI
jgi:amino acid adenylation domain-containing protein